MRAKVSKTDKEIDFGFKHKKKSLKIQYSSVPPIPKNLL